MEYVIIVATGSAPRFAGSKIHFKNASRALSLVP
jgi:hypothetical protein